MATVQQLHAAHEQIDSRMSQTRPTADQTQWEHFTLLSDLLILRTYRELVSSLSQYRTCRLEERFILPEEMKMWEQKAKTPPPFVLQADMNGSEETSARLHIIEAVRVNADEPRALTVDTITDEDWCKEDQQNLALLWQVGAPDTLLHYFDFAKRQHPGEWQSTAAITSLVDTSLFWYLYARDLVTEPDAIPPERRQYIDPGVWASLMARWETECFLRWQVFRNLVKKQGKEGGSDESPSNHNVMEDTLLIAFTGEQRTLHSFSSAEELDSFLSA